MKASAVTGRAGRAGDWLTEGLRAGELRNGWLRSSLRSERQEQKPEHHGRTGGTGTLRGPGHQYAVPPDPAKARRTRDRPFGKR